MRSNVEDKIDIAAKPPDVWKIVMDFDKYPDWNPMIVRLSKDPVVGSRLDASIKIGNRKPMTITPLVLKNETNKELRWAGTWVFDCLVRGEHYFRIEETPTGCTFYHGEDFSGIFVGIVFKILGKDLEQAYKDYNQAIKQRAESMTTN